MDEIKGFKGKYFYLSNYYSALVEYNNKVYNKAH